MTIGLLAAAHARQLHHGRKGAAAAVRAVPGLPDCRIHRPSGLGIRCFTPCWSLRRIGSGHFKFGYLQLAIGLIGTTIAPWMTFYLQASVVDKGVRKQDLPLRRFDVIFGAISADVIAFFIIVTSAVLYTGLREVQLA